MNLDLSFEGYLALSLHAGNGHVNLYRVIASLSARSISSGLMHHSNNDPGNLTDILVDDMDVQLLLILQKVCNQKNIKLPWDDVGTQLGATITGGAIIQHLAKLRARRVASGLKVPAPLKRGGGFSSAPATSSPVVGPSGKKRARSTKAASSIAPTMSNEDDEEDFDVDKASDPEDSFGETRFKRTKRGGASDDQQNDSDDEGGDGKGKGKVKGKGRSASEQNSNTKRGIILLGKRGKEKAKEFGSAEKYGKIKREELSDLPDVTAEERASRRLSLDYSKLNGEDSDEEDDFDPEETYVAAGAPFLRLANADEEDTGHYEDYAEDAGEGEGMDEYEENQEEFDASENNEGEQGDDAMANEGNTVHEKQRLILNLGKSEQSIELLKKLEESSSAESKAAYGREEGIVQLGTRVSDSDIPTPFNFGNNPMSMNLSAANHGQGLYPQQTYYGSGQYVASPFPKPANLGHGSATQRVLPQTPMTVNGYGSSSNLLYGSGMFTENFVPQSSGHSGFHSTNGMTAPSTPSGGRFANLPGTQNVNYVPDPHPMQYHNFGHAQSHTFLSNADAFQYGPTPALNNLSIGQETDTSDFTAGPDEFINDEDFNSLFGNGGNGFNLGF